MFAAQTLINPSVYQTTPFSVCIVNLFVADFPFSEILKGCSAEIHVQKYLSLCSATSRSEREAFLEISLK